MSLRKSQEARPASELGSRNSDARGPRRERSDERKEKRASESSVGGEGEREIRREARERE